MGQKLAKKKKAPKKEHNSANGGDFLREKVSLF